MSTKISWTSETWNPVVGCEQVSAGCDNCYAKTLHDMRHRAYLAGKRVLPQYAVPFETVQLMPHRIIDPLHWQKPRRVFVNSVSDLFHKDVPQDFLDRVFAVMALTERHTYQVLTKRPARMKAYIDGLADRGGSGRGFQRLEAAARGLGWTMEYAGTPLLSWPIRNVHLGASTEHQPAFDTRYKFLRETDAAVRFLSCEPLLGPLDLNLDGIHWVIVGGESGPNRREMSLEWLAGIVAQCRAANVPVFVKQDSGPKSEFRGRIPDDLWIREYPRSAA